MVENGSENKPRNRSVHEAGLYNWPVRFFLEMRLCVPSEPPFSNSVYKKNVKG